MNKFLLFLMLAVSNIYAIELVPDRIIGIASEKGFPNFTRDESIVSPKSVVLTKDGTTLLINALEANKTIAYETATWRKLWEVKHSFPAETQVVHERLSGKFKEFFRYPTKPTAWDAKPVEMALTPDGKILYTSSYRKSFDPHAHLASSVSAIEVSTGKLLYSLPAGPIPKMLKVSPDGTRLVVSNWGDNTVSFWNIEKEEPVLIAHQVVDYHLKVDILVGDRDKECGHCLRGTAFSPDGKYVMVSRMSGSIGLDTFESSTGKYIGLIPVPYPGIRHLTVWKDKFVASSTGGAWMAIAEVDSLLDRINKRDAEKVWTVYKTDSAIRTVSIYDDVALIAKHSKHEVALFDLNTRAWIKSNKSPAWPVGAVLGKNIAVSTAQGFNGTGGHRVAIFKVIN